MGVQELRTNHLRQMAVVLPSSLGVLTATVLRFGFGFGFGFGLADLLLVQRGRCLPSAELLGAEVLPCIFDVGMHIAGVHAARLSVVVHVFEELMQSWRTASRSVLYPLSSTRLLLLARPICHATAS